VDKETRKADFRLEPGLTLAIEPMVNMRKGDVDTLGDMWTVVTRDRMPSVHVEHTVALTAQGVVIITSDEGALVEEGDRGQGTGEKGQESVAGTHQRASPADLDPSL
jgi:methionyl aminopeptidase